MEVKDTNILRAKYLYHLSDDFDFVLNYHQPSLPLFKNGEGAGSTLPLSQQNESENKSNCPQLWTCVISNVHIQRIIPYSQVSICTNRGIVPISYTA